MTDAPKQDAPVYDAQGNVRPTDARYAGRNRQQLTNQELAAIREQEIAEATEELRKRQEALQAQNDQALLDAVASVSPADSDAAPAAADAEPKKRASSKASS
jgi:hypothetical protein